MNLVNKYSLILPLDYALSTHSRETNLKLLLNQADKNMYECKARMKAKKKI